MPKIEVLESEEKISILRELDYKKLLIAFLFLVAFVGIGGSVYFYNKYKSLKVDANIEAKKETERLTSLLGKLIELPSGETPTIATISDKEKLKDQSFFNQAQNGDILFAYETSMKAILYRPSSNKIINVAPISINQTKEATQNTTPKTTPSLNSGVSR